jgi:hypothetical protein
LDQAPPVTDAEIAALLSKERAPECKPGSLRRFAETVDELRERRNVLLVRQEADALRRRFGQPLTLWPRAAKALSELRRTFPEIIEWIEHSGVGPWPETQSEIKRLRQWLAAAPDISSLPPPARKPDKATLEDIRMATEVYEAAYGPSRFTRHTPAAKVVAALLTKAGFRQVTATMVAKRLYDSRRRTDSPNR